MNLPETIVALKQGDEFIFGEIFNEFHQKIYFYTLAKTKSTYLAEEVVQLTFIKLWNNRIRLNEDLPLSTQLFQIAKTTCIDLLRQEGHRSKLTLVQGDEQQFGHGDEQLSNKELQSKLSLEVQKMPPVRKMIFELSRYESKTYKEIAHLLSISEKTVENHISLALKQLRRVLTIFCLFFLR